MYKRLNGFLIDSILFDTSSIWIGIRFWIEIWIQFQTSNMQIKCYEMFSIGKYALEIAMSFQPHKRLGYFDIELYKNTNTDTHTLK